jgi:hypothetical protein
MVAEKWKPVIGYEDYYQVSDLGRVRSLDRVVNSRNNCTRIIPGRILKPINSGGRYIVFLTDGNSNSRQRRIHHMVLETFVGPRPKGMDGCHDDDIQDNNKLSNLRWDTRSENLKDKFRNGYKNANSRRVRRSDGVEYESASAAAREVPTSQGSISNVCRGNQYMAAGFTWEYI